jgi:CBS domain-containing protein
MKASEFMTDQVITCHQNDDVAKAAQIMAEKGFSIMPVVDDEEHLVGVVTQSDFVGKEVEIPHALASIKQLFGQVFYFSDIEPIYEQAKKKKLHEVMSKVPTVVSPDTSLTEIVNMMISKKLKRLPVLENNKIVGIITRKNLIKAFNEVNK